MYFNFSLTNIDIIFTCHKNQNKYKKKKKNPHQKSNNNGTILYITLNHMKCVSKNGRQLHPKWKTTSPRMEDDLIQNGRRSKKEDDQKNGY